jgi:hypothetical protein
VGAAAAVVTAATADGRVDLYFFLPSLFVSRVRSFSSSLFMTNLSQCKQRGSDPAVSLVQERDSEAARQSLEEMGRQRVIRHRRGRRRPMWREVTDETAATYR